MEPTGSGLGGDCYARDAFYEGRIARTIDGYFKRIGGWLSLEDLRAHRSEWVEPLRWRPMQGQTQIIVNRVDYGLDIQAAGAAPADEAGLAAR